MPPQRHRYTRCVLFTGERANKSNERVVCKYCSEAESPQWAMQHALLCNTKKLVKNHLRRCRHFQLAQTNGTDDKLVFTEDEDTDDENQRTNNKRKTFVTADANSNIAPTLEGKRARVEDAATGSAAIRRVSSNARLPIELGTSGHAAIVSLYDQATFGRLLLDATLVNGWCFSWVENQASAKVFNYLLARARLPTKEALGGEILELAAKKEAHCVSAAVATEKLGCTIVLDSWDHLVSDNRLGMVMTTSKGEVFVWNVKEAIDGVDREAVGDAMTSTLNALAVESVPLVALVADSSDVYTDLRRSVRRKRRDLMALPCLVHQLNALAADIIQLVPAWYEAVVKSMELLHVVEDTPTSQYKSIQEEPKLGSVISSECSWQVVVDCIASAVQKLKNTQEADSATYHPSATDTASVSNEELIKSLTSLSSVLVPLVHWIAHITTLQGRLHCVPLISHGITTSIQQLTPEVALPLTETIEARWNEWEHPLMILAVVFNPAYGWSSIHKDSGVTLMHLGCWARYYYQSFFGDRPVHLSSQVIEYVEGDKFWCSSTSIASFTAPVESRKSTLDPELIAKLSYNVTAYWKSCKADCPELARLALRVFAVTITSASTDGLFDSLPALEAAPVSDDLRIGALRVRASARYENRQQQQPIDTTAKVSRTMDRAMLDKLIQRWSSQQVKPFDEGVQRKTDNENEAINDLYANIHPAEDKHSKHALRSLFDLGKVEQSV